MRSIATITCRNGIPTSVPTDAEFIDYDFADAILEVRFITRGNQNCQPRTFLLVDIRRDYSIADGFKFLMMKEGCALFVR